MWIVLLVLLLVFTYFDVKEKALPVWLLAAAMVMSATASLFLCEGVLKERLLQMAASVLPGILLTLLSFLFRGKLGIGDGLVLIVIGNLTGWKNAVWILFGAVFLSFFYSCWLLVFGKKGRNYGFPFLPFYFCAAVIVWIVTKGC